MSRVAMLICPHSEVEVTPLKTWESRLPDGHIIHYGQFQLHYHWGQECEWSYLVQALTEGEEQSPFICI